MYTCMYQIHKFFFRNDLSNPIATDLGGEIDVSFIIATHYFSFDIFGPTVPLFCPPTIKPPHF